jgi:hypothetical protein
MIISLERLKLNFNEVKMHGSARPWHESELEYGGNIGERNVIKTMRIMNIIIMPVLVVVLLAVRVVLLAVRMVLLAVRVVLLAVVVVAVRA